MPEITYDGIVMAFGSAVNVCCEERERTEIEREVVITELVVGKFEAFHTDTKYFSY